MSTAPVTPFTLGVYVGSPDNTSVAAEAQFEANYSGFTTLMGAAPKFLTNFIDYNKPVSAWIGNAQWSAASAAQSPDAKSLTPVIALPMASLVAGSAAPDQQYQAFASGQYDTTLQGIVKGWAQQGFTSMMFRPGWEMNLQGPSYAGSTAQSQADWVSAFQHIYTVLHQAAAADGVNVQVVWNPGRHKLQQRRSNHKPVSGQPVCRCHRGRRIFRHLSVLRQQPDAKLSRLGYGPGRRHGRTVHC